LAFVVLLVPSLLFSANPKNWKAGLAKIPITPQESIWMGGYSARSKPSEGTYEELYAKALALEDQSGRRAVFVTTDLVGMPASLTRKVAERVQKQYNLPRDRLLLNSSHTHCGPVVASDYLFYDMPADQLSRVENYTSALEDKLVAVIGEALNHLEPARLSFGRTEAGFAMNRRENQGRGLIDLKNAKGPVDHEVPFLRIEGKHGKLRGVVFGYACHNTTLGPTFCQFYGDYAGDAQKWLEEHNPGALALFVAGCGGDANPYPRENVDFARQHGEELATAVEMALRGSMQTVSGPLKTAWEEFPVQFAPPPTREELQKRLSSNSIYVRKHAQAMLDILDREGRLPTEYPYSLEVWQFGRDLTLVAMAGEVVVDYALRLKKELGPGNVWVAGYCNDVFAYIPSLRVLREGGYEGGDAMIYYGQPGPFAPSIEETVVGKVHELVQRLCPNTRF
jgi:hypothetical protein